MLEYIAHLQQEKFYPVSYSFLKEKITLILKALVISMAK